MALRKRRTGTSPHQRVAASVRAMTNGLTRVDGGHLSHVLLPPPPHRHLPEDGAAEGLDIAQLHRRRFLPGEVDLRKTRAVEYVYIPIYGEVGYLKCQNVRNVIMGSSFLFSGLVFQSGRFRKALYLANTVHIPRLSKSTREDQ